MVAFTEQSSWLLHVRLLSPNQGHVAFTGSRRNFQLSGQWVQLPRGAAGPTGPMPLLLGPEIGPLNLGRSEGDISSAWPFNSDGPNIYFFLSLLTPDSRSPWYWCPPDYPYQQVLYNSEMIQNYYPQFYAPQSSPSGSPYQYMGYMTGGLSPRAGFPPMQQHARPLFQQPTAQMEGSFPPAPSLPPNFRLQLPPHAVPRQSDDAPGPQSTHPSSTNAATSASNEEASTPVTSNSDPSATN